MKEVHGDMRHAAFLFASACSFMVLPGAQAQEPTLSVLATSRSRPSTGYLYAHGTPSKVKYLK
ncbi:Fc.00g016860.m01.CDS01 [Cosmosporella sp. VM-42]